MSETVTKEGLVPKLRFPEFHGEWERRKLSDLTIEVGENVGNERLVPVSISAGRGFVPQTEKFGRDISGDQYRRYTRVSAGTFVYNRGNSLTFPEGCVYRYTGAEPIAAPAVFTCFRPKGEIVPSLLEQLFAANLHGKQLRRVITSSARSNGLLNISDKAFFSINVPTPGVAEQEKIAECLQSLDELIAAETEKLEALKRHKKGLLQQLFPAEGETTPRLRFSWHTAAWRSMKLGTLIRSLSSGKDYKDESGQYKLYGSTGVIGATSGASYAGDHILVARVGANAGFLTHVRAETFGATDNTLVLSLIGEACTRFIFYYLDNLNLNQMIFGSGQPLITGSQLRSLSLSVPPLKEQIHIAAALCELDQTIDLTGERVSALKAQKQSLMQQLFPWADEINQ